MNLGERFAFWRQFRHQFATTGAVQPSSRFLAAAMVAPVRRHRSTHRTSVHIIEMGPGTGAVTRAIAAVMRPEDRLDCYEINAQFADYLRRAVATGAEYRHAADRITVHCLPAQAAAAEVPVDFVICSVPLNNLPHPMVAEIFHTGLDLLAPDGVFTYFEYPLLPSLHRLMAPAAERERIDAVGRIKQQANGTDRSSQIVLRNIPPARAVHIRST